MKNAILFCLLLLYIPLNIQARSRLQGSIGDSSNAPLSFCSITLLGPADSIVKGTLSDANGAYLIEQVSPGIYKLKISLMGFETYTTDTFRVREKDTLQLPYIQMTRTGNTLQEVAISAPKRLLEIYPDKMILNVANSVLTNGNSAFEVIRKAPAVTVDKDDNLLLKGAAAKIFINGKPAYLSGLQLTEYLKNLPADAVGSIEIMTNPSGKYDAAGSAGIINIKLKKNTLFGTNGTLNAGSGYGKYPKANAGINLNHRNAKLNLFGGAYISYSESFNQLNYNSILHNNNTTTYQDRDNYWHPKTTWGSFNTGLDYSLSSKSVMGILINGDLDRANNRTDNTTTLRGPDEQPYTIIRSRKDETQRGDNVSANLNFKTELDSIGSQFSIDADYAAYIHKENDTNYNQFTDAAGMTLRAPYSFTNSQPVHVQIQSLKADYTRYFAHTLKLEAGLKSSRVASDNTLQADSLQGGTWVNDAGRSNHFRYIEYINAAYLTLSRQWGNTSVQAGLRAEQTNSEGISQTLNRTDKRSYLDFFPSIFLMHKLNDRHSFNFSLTRRIDRPGYLALNPFVTYVDPFTLFQGNPFLKPAYSYSAELKHQYKDILFTTLSYRHTHDITINTIVQDAVAGTTTNIIKNADAEDALRLDIALMLNITSWWNTENNLGLAFNQGHSTLTGYSYNTRAFAGDFSTSHTFTLPADFRLQTDLYYYLPTRNGLERTQAAYGWSLGLQKQLWHKKASLKLSFNNIIGQNAYRAHFLGEGLDIRWKNQWEGRRINLSFVYKFGNQDVRSRRERRSGSAEEKSRVGL